MQADLTEGHGVIFFWGYAAARRLFASQPPRQKGPTGRASGTSRPSRASPTPARPRKAGHRSQARSNKAIKMGDSDGIPRPPAPRGKPHNQAVHPGGTRSPFWGYGHGLLPGLRRLGDSRRGTHRRSQRGIGRCRRPKLPDTSHIGPHRHHARFARTTNAARRWLMMQIHLAQSRPEAKLNSALALLEDSNGRDERQALASRSRSRFRRVRRSPRDALRYPELAAGASNRRQATPQSRSRTWTGAPTIDWIPASRAWRTCSPPVAFV